MIIELDNQELLGKKSVLSDYFQSIEVPEYQVRRCGESPAVALDQVSRLAGEDLAQGRLHTNYVLEFRADIQI